MAKAMKSSLLQSLAGVPLFRNLQESELLDILRSATLRTFATGEAIVNEGERGSSLYIILKGRTKVTAAHPDGAEHLLAFLGKGQFFGEMALLSNQPRSATVTAVEEITALEVSKTGLEGVFLKRPAIRDTLEKYRLTREQDTAELLRSPTEEERRLHRRLPVAVPCRFRLSAKHGERMVTRIVCGMTDDVSEAGLKIEVDVNHLASLHSPLPGTNLRIELEVPKTRRLVRMTGEVRWCHQRGQGRDSRMNMGILITQMSQADRGAWLGFINAEQVTSSEGTSRTAKVHTIDV